MQVKTSGNILGVVEDVAFKYAKNTYGKLRAQVARQVERDVMAEFSYMAGLFKQFTIGIGPGNTAPIGTLKPAHDWSSVASGMGLLKAERAGQGIEWASRTKRYMAWKQKHFGHGRWFLNNNQVIPGALGSAKNWVSYFGPIEVHIKPIGAAAGSTTPLKGTQGLNRAPYQAGKYTKFLSAEATSDAGHIRTGVANISVAALTYITPGMLPGLANGTMRMPNDSRKTGLLAMLPAPVRERLGGRQARYRHTIEPFLTYFLTRAVPNALFLRLEHGLGVKLEAQRRTR
jgi:hypothetical protein